MTKREIAVPQSALPNIAVNALIAISALFALMLHHVAGDPVYKMPIVPAPILKASYPVPRSPNLFSSLRSVSVTHCSSPRVTTTRSISSTQDHTIDEALSWLPARSLSRMFLFSPVRVADYALGSSLLWSSDGRSFNNLPLHSEALDLGLRLQIFCRNFICRVPSSQPSFVTFRSGTIERFRSSHKLAITEYSVNDSRSYFSHLKTI